jgi:hypothetical protein
MAGPYLGQFRAEQVMACRTKISPVSTLGAGSHHHDSSAWALQTSLGEYVAAVTISIPADNQFLPIILQIMAEMRAKRPGKRDIKLADKGTRGVELALSKDPSGEVAFDLSDPICLQYGLEHLPYRISMIPDTSDLYLVLAATADFFFLLRHSKRGLLSKHIKIEAYRLEEHFPEEPGASDLYSGLGAVMRPDGDDLNVGGVMIANAYDKSEEDDCIDPEHYGFKIVSTYNSPLYVWIFAFEMNTLSISSYFLWCMLSFCLTLSF